MMVNEFTNQQSSAKYGKSPGKYITDYMSREKDTEQLLPYQDLTEDAVSRINQRVARVKNAQYRPRQISRFEEELFNEKRLDGRSFGNGKISLSQKALYDSSRRIQKAFDEGHSVQKLVVSFSHGYLRKKKVIPDDFKYRGRESFRGQVDHLKLRQAVVDGMTAYLEEGGFKDPEWVGALQLDTTHPHVHLAIADKAWSSVRAHRSGGDRGKANTREMRAFRLACDASLDRLLDLKPYVKQPQMERNHMHLQVLSYQMDWVASQHNLQAVQNAATTKVQVDETKQYVERLYRDQPVASGYSEASYQQNRLAQGDAHVKKVLYDQIVQKGVETVLDTILPKDMKTVQTDYLTLLAQDEASFKHAEQQGFQSPLGDLVIKPRRSKQEKQEALEQVRQFKSFIERFDETPQSTFAAYAMRWFYEMEMLRDLTRLRLEDQRLAVYDKEEDEALYEGYQKRYNQLESFQDHFDYLIDGICDGVLRLKDYKDEVMALSPFEKNAVGKYRDRVIKERASGLLVLKPERKSILLREEVPYSSDETSWRYGVRQLARNYAEKTGQGSVIFDQLDQLDQRLTDEGLFTKETRAALVLKKRAMKKEDDKKKPFDYELYSKNLLDDLEALRDDQRPRAAVKDYFKPVDTMSIETPVDPLPLLQYQLTSSDFYHTLEETAQTIAHERE